MGSLEDYDREKIVGSGAYGKVWRCRRKREGGRKGELVILKEVGTEWSESDRVKGAEEAEIMSKLSHPHIVAYHNSFIHEGALHIVMDYAPDGTLAELIRARRGCLFDETCASWMLVQLSLALHYLHSKEMMHRDLKTANVLVKDSQRLLLLLSDFGIARSVVSGSAQTVIGTPNYMSPEMCRGEKYGKAGDVWSLGCVAVEVLTLKRAFEDTSHNALFLRICTGNLSAPPLPQIFSEELRQLVAQCLHLRPEERPSTPHIIAAPPLRLPLIRLLTSHGAIQSQSPS